jgi:hypothetical protein
VFSFLPFEFRANFSLEAISTLTLHHRSQL